MEANKIRKTGLFLCFILAIAAHGCAPELEASLFDAQRTMAADVGDDSALGTGEGDVNDLTGTWALFGDWSTCVTIVGRTELRSRYTHLVQIEQEGPVLRETHTICEAQNTPLLGLQTVVSDAILEAASPIKTESTLIGTGTSSGIVGGTQVQLWGLELDSPLTEALPSKEEALDDPRVVDSDQDGLPGATLKLGGDQCDVYVIQRAVSAVVLDLVSGVEARGSGYMRTEQVVIDATSALCAAPFATSSNDAHSATVMYRVDEEGLGLDADGDGEVSCGEVRAAAAGLVTWLEPDDARCE